MFQLGFDIGGTNIAAGIVDQDTNVVAKISYPFPRKSNTDHILKLLEDMAVELCGLAGISMSMLVAVGVAVPGSISEDGQSVIDAYNLGFHNVPLKTTLQQIIGLPVFLCNDANAATLAEYACGSLKGCKTAVLLTLGTGVGGGLILNGRMFNGGRNMGVELGHMFLRSGGRRCTCGNLGCIECYCSATRLCNDCGVGQAKTVFELAELGDNKAKELLFEYIDDLGSAIASIVNLLDPEKVAIGGGVSHAGDALLVSLNENVRKKCFFATCPPIVQATLKNDAGFIGAALLHLNNV